MSRSMAPPLLLALAAVLGACCTTPQRTAELAGEDGATVTAAGWASEAATPPERTGLPRVGTMTTPGSEPLSPRERQDEMDSLRRANRNLMDQVAKLMHEVEIIREKRSEKAPAEEPAPALAPAEPAPEPARIDVARVRGILRRAGAGDLEVDENGDGLVVVRLSGGMAFASGKAELSAAARGKIRRIGPALARELGEVRIRVEGHTDSDPIRRSKWASNEALSLARAGAVAAYLQKVSGIAAERIETAGYGDARPIAPNSTRAGKARNRRVELVLVP